MCGLGHITLFALWSWTFERAHTRRITTHVRHSKGSRCCSQKPSCFKHAGPWKLQFPVLLVCVGLLILQTPLNPYSHLTACARSWSTTTKKLCRCCFSICETLTQVWLLNCCLDWCCDNLQWCFVASKVMLVWVSEGIQTCVKYNFCTEKYLRFTYKFIL